MIESLGAQGLQLAKEKQEYLGKGPTRGPGLSGGASDEQTETPGRRRINGSMMSDIIIDLVFLCGQIN